MAAQIAQIAGESVRFWAHGVFFKDGPNHLQRWAIFSKDAEKIDENGILHAVRVLEMSVVSSMEAFSWDTLAFAMGHLFKRHRATST